VILRSIRVANWRCLLEEIEVGPFEDGLNILHAPNGFGKSTLFEALRRGLLDGHRVTGRDVEALRPWGRTLAPHVTVELAHGGQEYRVSKQFLDSPSALLERKEEGRWRRLAEGTAADERAREILRKNPPGRGLARPENWGLAQVLWAAQGSLLLSPLSGDLVTDIRTTLSVQVSGKESGPLEQRIEERYLELFTPKGKLKTGKDAPRLSRLREALAEAAEGRRKAYDLCMGFEEASRKVEELQARRAQARHTAEETAKALREARTDLDVYQNLVAERKQRSEQVMAAEERYKRLKQLIDLIRATELELKQAREDLGALERDIPLREREVQEREREAARLRAALEDARKGREAVEAAARLAETARRVNESSRDLSRLDELVRRIREGENTVAVEKERRRAMIAPDGKVLRAIRKAIKERDDARVRLEASLITLEIVPRANGAVEVVAGEAAGTRALTAGVPTQIQGSPEVVAELPGIARLRARGPAGSVDEHREARTQAEGRLAELTRPFGTPDPDALESLNERARELDANIAQGEARLETLRAGRTTDQLIEARTVLESTLRRFLEGHPEWGESPPDAEALGAVAGPVEAVATRTLQRIAGRRLGRIRMGEGFEPAAVVPDVVHEAVTLDNLSGGEQVQL
jgi:hypothetical protein